MTITEGVVGTVIGLVPITSIFTAGRLYSPRPEKAIRLKGRPPSSVFAIVWTLIGIILLSISALSCLSLDVGIYIWIACLLLVQSAASVLWLYYNAVNESAAPLAIGLLMLASLLLTVSLSVASPRRAIGNMEPPVINLSLAASSCVPLAWAIYALGMDLVSRNMVHESQQTN